MIRIQQRMACSKDIQAHDKILPCNGTWLEYNNAWFVAGTYKDTINDYLAAVHD